MTPHIGFVGSQCRPMVARLMAVGTPLAWYAPDVTDLANGVLRADNAVHLAQVLHAPRVVWLRLPDGFTTELAIQDVWPELTPGDVVVDAGAGAASDGRRRSASLASARIRFVDCGVAGGAWFVGGEADAVRAVSPYLDTIAGRSGWTHAGPAGTGYRA